MSGPDPIVRYLAVETPEAVTVRYRLAGLGSRGAAALIDTGLLILLVLAEAGVGVALALGVLRVGDGRLAGLVPWIAGGVILAVFATYWGYYILGEVSGGGATPGKRVMGIRVVRDDGSRAGVLDSIVRNVVRVIDLMPGTYAVGIAAMLLSPAGKRLGDMAAGTAVIEDRGHDLTGGPPLAEEADERVALVRDYLGRRSGFTPEARGQVALELLALWGEEERARASAWDEPTAAGRLADLAGVR